MREDFNWSLLNRNSLYSMLYRAGRDIIGKKIPVDTLHKYLSNHIKSNLPVKVMRRQFDPTQTRGFPYMGGLYDGEADNAGKSRFISIILAYHPDDTEVRITDYRWTRLCSLFADTILHEIIHMRQYRSRNFKDIPGYESTAYYRKQRLDQEYYAHRDEMGAFSFNIACDMIDRFGYDPKIIKKYMDSMQAKRHKRTTFCKYLTAFDWNHNHPKIRQMKIKILKQLEYAAIGKPFKTNNFITY
jgi:hypothetical protein